MMRLLGGVKPVHLSDGVRPPLCFTSGQMFHAPDLCAAAGGVTSASNPAKCYRTIASASCLRCRVAMDQATCATSCRQSVIAEVNGSVACATSIEESNQIAEIVGITDGCCNDRLHACCGRPLTRTPASAIGPMPGSAHPSANVLRAAWLGLTRDVDNDNRLTQWHSGCQTTHENWHSGQPDDQPDWLEPGREREDCTAMFADGTWYDVPCTRISACICEFTIPPPPPAPPPMPPPSPSPPPLPPVTVLCSLTCGVSVTWVVVGVLLLLLMVRSYHQRSIARLQSYRHQLQVAMIQSAVMRIPTSPVRRAEGGASTVSSPADPESPDSVPWEAARRSEAAAATASVSTSTAAAVSAEGECAICLCEFNEDELVKQLPCEHVYHAACIDRWLLKERETTLPSCPLCKVVPFQFCQPGPGEETSSTAPPVGLRGLPGGPRRQARRVEPAPMIFSFFVSNVPMAVTRE